MAIPINEDPYMVRFRSSRVSKDSLESFSENLVIPLPASLEFLCLQTRFSRRELRHLYRTFKKFCPYGVLTKEDFKQFYAHIFPNSKSEAYALFIFRGFDLNKDEFVCFEDLAETYSILTRGSPSEKLSWLFDLYDINDKGTVGRLEILAMARSFYALSTANQEPDVTPEHVFGYAIQVYELRQLSNDIIKSMSSPEVHHMTREQFIAYGLKNEHFLDAFQAIMSG